TCQTVNLKTVWDGMELSFICHPISKIQKESGKKWMTQMKVALVLMLMMIWRTLRALNFLRH
ncbi:hypothetical protein BDQ17DRAFT_1373899, partial [Cyathus striatus]